MSTRRQRMTWAALDREAAAAPAIPGYGVEDQDHPAHTQDDPGSAPYIIGGPSEFGEDVHQPPYGDSGPPATPGMGVEDQDHPAHQGQVGRNASIMELVRRKTAKALVLARATLGKTAGWDDIENQAFAYMSMDDQALDASVGRLGGDFLGMDDLFMDDESGEDFGEPVPADDGLMARMQAMEEELMAMRAASGKKSDQNDPDGETLGAPGKSEDEEKKEEDAANKEARSAPFLAMFDAYDTDGDGFVTDEDWGGPRSMFASLDTDNDGIIARHEVQAGCEKLPEGPMRDNCESGAPGQEKKAGDDEDDVEASDDDEGSDKEASKVAFGGLADFDDDELDMLQAMQYGEDEDDEVMGCGDVMASKKADDEDEEDDEDYDKEAAIILADDDGDEDDDEGDSDKEASFFATGFDPMGLDDGTSLTAADKAAFNKVFGSDDDDADDADDADEGSDKEASLEQMLRPQARKASTGVKSVGAVA